MFFILGIIPYAAIGMILASMGYNYTTWQWWAISEIALANISELKNET